MTQLKHITMNHLSFECKSCGHSPLIPVTEMIKRYGGETSSIFFLLIFGGFFVVINKGL